MSHKTLVIGSVLIFLLDRFLKLYAQHLPPGKVFAFLPGLQLGYFSNPALFFSPAWDWIPWLSLTVLITILSIVIWGFIENWKSGIGNLLPQNLFPILLGGASNTFDRFTYDGVIDYALLFNRATVNLADWLILGGLLILLIRPPRRQPPN